VFTIDNDYTFNKAVNIYMSEIAKNAGFNLKNQEMKVIVEFQPSMVNDRMLVYFFSPISENLTVLRVWKAI
jgi:hypothetical protein